MATRFKQMLIYMMLLGVIGLGLNTIFGLGANPYIYKIADYTTGITYWRYDFANYFKNISTKISQITDLSIDKPTDVWMQAGEWGAIINNLKFIANYIIFAINWMVYPIRVGAYLVNNIWAILGLREFNGSSTEGHATLFALYKLTEFMKSLVIPYIT